MRFPCTLALLALLPFARADGQAEPSGETAAPPLPTWDGAPRAEPTEAAAPPSSTLLPNPSAAGGAPAVWRDDLMAPDLPGGVVPGQGTAPALPTGTAVPPPGAPSTLPFPETAPEEPGWTVPPGQPGEWNPDVPFVLTPVPDLPDMPDLPGSTAPKVRWDKNPREARERAIDEGKYFLLAFVGLGWNSTCKRLEEEVFSTPDFARFASEKLVLSYLDYPMDLSERSVPPIYLHFREFCDVNGYPAIAIFDPEGERLETIVGYRPKRSQTYLERLKDIVQRHEEKRRGDARVAAQLEAAGFRTWEDENGRSLTAKLRGVAGQRAYFLEPDGTKSHVPLSQLRFTHREVARRLAQQEGTLK